jgi:hypothetical protein
MSYNPSNFILDQYSSFGYVTATPVTTTNISQIVFDTPSESGVTVSGGSTYLPTDSLCIMRVGRTDDASGESRFWYSMGNTSPAFSGLVEAITTKYFHAPAESFAHTSIVTPTQIHQENSSSNIQTNTWSQVMYWRTL